VAEMPADEAAALRQALAQLNGPSKP